MDWFDDDDDEKDAILLKSLENLDMIADLDTDEKSQALIIATRQQKISLTSSLIMSGANINEEDEFGCTPLMFAASYGLVESLIAMVKHPMCSINKRSHSMQTALHFAAKKGKFECVEVLLAHKAMPNVSDDWGETPLMLAVKGDSIDSVYRLLEEGAKLGMTNLRGMDALMYAAQGGHTAIMSCLIKHGCEINKIIKTSPLHQAAVFGHVACVCLLLMAGGKADMRDVHGKLPIELATNTDKHRVVETLLQHGTSNENKNFALAAAAKSNAIFSVNTLLKWNANPGAVDMQGLPAFFWAVAQNNIEIVKSFIRYNVDINKTLSRVYLMNSELREFSAELDLDFVTAVVIAAFRDYIDLVQILVLAGAVTDDVTKLLKQNQQSSFSKDDTMLSWLHYQSTRPRSLTSLCRTKIRTYLPNVTFNQILELPLPKPVKEYLNFSDLDTV